MLSLLSSFFLFSLSLKAHSSQLNLCNIKSNAAALSALPCKNKKETQILKINVASKMYGYVHGVHVLIYAYIAQKR